MPTRAVRPDYAYLKLRCFPATKDTITWQLIIERAMSKFGGLMGRAIPIDLMYISPMNSELNCTEAIVRCPIDKKQFVAAGIGGSVLDEHSVQLIDESNFLNMLI